MEQMYQQLPPDVTRILYVTNLPKEIDGEMLYKIFGKFGPLRQVRVSSEQETRGSAFVAFEDIYDAKRAVEELVGFRLSKSKYLQILYYDKERHAKYIERKKRHREQLADYQQRQRQEFSEAAAEAAKEA